MLNVNAAINPWTIGPAGLLMNHIRLQNGMCSWPYSVGLRGQKALLAAVACARISLEAERDCRGK